MRELDFVRDGREVSLKFGLNAVVVALSSNAFGDGRLRRKICGELLVFLCICDLYAYGNGRTNRSQFLR